MFSPSSSTFQVQSVSPRIGTSLAGTNKSSVRSGSGRALPPIPPTISLPSRPSALPSRPSALPSRPSALPRSRSPNTFRRYGSAGASDNLVLASDRRPFGDKYCSCVFKVTGTNYKTNYPAPPQAICSSTIYNRKGMKGPGSSIRCAYPEEYLDRLSYDELFYFAAAKGIISDAEYGLDRNDVKEIILEWEKLEKGIEQRRKPGKGWNVLPESPV